MKTVRMHLMLLETGAQRGTAGHTAGHSGAQRGTAGHAAEAHVKFALKILLLFVLCDEPRERSGRALRHV